MSFSNIAKHKHSWALLKKRKKRRDFNLLNKINNLGMSLNYRLYKNIGSYNVLYMWPNFVVEKRIFMS